MSNLNNVLEDIWRDGYNAGSYNARRKEKDRTDFTGKQTTASQIEKDLLEIINSCSFLGNDDKIKLWKNIKTYLGTKENIR